MSDIRKLLDVMAQLRHPKTGCGWDVEQTFSTISPYTIEEAYEVADAIERDDMDDLCDELGDLLLQVVFHSRIAEEAGHFDFGDVVEAIVDKMIRRHPHVFGDEGEKPVHDSTQSLKQAWEAEKARERAAKAEAKNKVGKGAATKEATPVSALDDVALNLPALTRAAKIQKRAARVGFDWQEAAPVFDKIAEEVDEVREAIASSQADKVNDEIGDLLFTVVNLARHCNSDPENALRASTAKFSYRFRHVESSAMKRELDLKQQPLAVLDELWDDAKRAESKPTVSP